MYGLNSHTRIGGKNDNRKCNEISDRTGINSYSSCFWSFAWHMEFKHTVSYIAHTLLGGNMVCVFSTVWQPHRFEIWFE